MRRNKFVRAVKQKVYDLTEEEDPNAPKSILLLEDETQFAEMVKEYLESCNFSVTVACDGVQGLRKIMEKDFDVIVCDLLMPNLPGDMFYLGVERVKPHLARRFIFITGHKDNPKVAEFIRKARALTLFKPFELHILHETVLVALKNAQKAKAKP